MELPLVSTKTGSMSPDKTWTTKRWKLLWCHERCFKTENESVRQLIDDGVQQRGGTLVCLKKAQRFAMWLERTATQGYVLLTDWREAQPCIQALQQKPASHQPEQTIVLCGSPKQYRRAKDWAMELPCEVGTVHVCEISDIPTDLLQGHLRRCFAAGSLKASSSTSSESLCRPMSLPAAEVDPPPGLPGPSDEDAESEVASNNGAWYLESGEEEVELAEDATHAVHAAAQQRSVVPATVVSDSVPQQQRWRTHQAGVDTRDVDHGNTDYDVHNHARLCQEIWW